MNTRPPCNVFQPDRAHEVWLSSRLLECLKREEFVSQEWLAVRIVMAHDIWVNNVLNPPCPWLPPVSEIHDFTITRRHGADKGPGFYQDALCYAQSQWISGKPAQAILQLDKAWMADLPPDHPVLVAHPPPWQAMSWLLRASSSGTLGYLGNPVRHFQHLASRMSGPRAEIRSWRAWLCFHLAERVLPGPVYPRDGRQIAREGIWIPGNRRALDAIERLGWQGEAGHAALQFEQLPKIPGNPFPIPGFQPGELQNL